MSSSRSPSYVLRGLPLLCVLLSLLGCQQPSGEDAPTLLRLNPTSVQGQHASEALALFDRDTTTGMVLERPVKLTLHFAHDVHPQRLKLFARGKVRAELDGAPAFEALGGEAWESLTATALPVAQRTLTLTLTPLGAQARVEEVELWGPGLVPAPREAQWLAERSLESGDLGLANIHVFSAQPGEATLTPRGLAEGESCASFSLAVPLPLRTVRRAHLVYEADGLQRPVVLRRSLNGQPAQGGFWLGQGGRRRTLADELNPEWLTGQELVTLCLPEAATDRVTLSGVRLLLEQDDGSQPFEREVLLRLGAAVDGDARTSASLPAGALELPFARPTSVDSAVLEVDVPASEVGTASFDGSAWEELGALNLERGRNALALEGHTSRGVRMAFGAGRRPDVPAASVSELLVTGSGVGPRLGGPRLVISYPLLRAQGERLLAEHFDGRAFLSGWAESPAGRGVVEVDGVPVDTGDGAFGVELLRPAGKTEWSVTVTARFPDGSEVRRLISFDRNGAEELAAEGVDSSGGNSGTEAALFGEEEQTAWGRVDREKGGLVSLGSRVTFEAPPGAVDGALSVGITRKVPEALPPLDPGMVNVTAPVNAGYRFSPPGQRFHKPVTVRLPYEPSLLPEGMSPEQVQTFYFDRGEGQWKPLARKQVLRASRQVVSETTHFTFMINAVLVLPDHPGPIAFDPNSIKDLKAADPSANMELMEPPEGNNQGTARVGMALRLPGARGAYAPSLQLSYDSNGGNGWVGVGWDLSVSSIQVDTRYGAPFYDGSERFVLDGAQLVPVGEGPCVGGGTGTRYAARVEGAFQRIVRCGQGEDVHFEVSRQDGVLLLYGVTSEARLVSPYDSQHIAQWMVERVLDAHDNLTLYRYEADFRKQPGTRFDQDNPEPFRQLYPREILYSGKVARADVLKKRDDFQSVADPGPYLVTLELERNGGAFLERPDIQISGRMGFKVVTRYRLGRVKVRLNTAQGDTGVIREYRFTYERGDFGKSRLKKVEQFGTGGVEGGALFHSHELEYRNVDDLGASAFPEVVAWPVPQDDEALTGSTEWALGSHAYAGIGFTFNKQAGSVGARVGFNHRESTTHSTLLDLNGDGLVDRVSKKGNALRVLLSDAQARRMSAVAPEGDPYEGGSLSPVDARRVSLGAESGDSLNTALQATFANFSANVGWTRTWSTSTHFMLDADGDGLVDAIGPEGIFFNQQRGTEACPASSFCFSPSKPVSGRLDFSNLSDAQEVFAGDPTVEEAQAEAEEDFHPTDAMLEWTAPYTGTVDLSGVLKWSRDHEPTPGRDGVRLRVYRDGELLAEQAKAFDDNVPTEVSLTGVSVQARQRLYFVLSTLRDFAVDTGVSPPVPLEKVGFAPVVRYTACSGGCGGIGPGDLELEAPTGASLFTFDAEKDFKLAGEPLQAVQAPREGVLRLTGSYHSDGVADDVRLCVQRFPPGQVEQRPCADSDLLHRSYAGGVGEESFTETLVVRSGETLLFRMETDLPIDPDRVSWNMAGEMTEVCDGQGRCEAPKPDERERLRFEAEPYLPLHEPVEDVPPRPFIVPHRGTLYVRSSAMGAPEQVFSVRKHHALLLKHRAGESRTASFPVEKGEQLFFQAHGPQPSPLTLWNLAVELEVAGGDAGVSRIPLDVPRYITSEGGSGVKRSPFGGGFHGWRYGVWGGRPAREGQPEEVFDPSIFYSDASLELGEGSDREQFREGKKQLRDGESEMSRRSRLFMPLVPRRRGTKVMETVPGLEPAPAYVSQDGSAFIGQGTMHGGHKGALASGPGGTRTVDASFRIGKTARASTADSFAGGLGASLGPGSLSLNVSSGHTSQRMDVRDMNGDGIIDVLVSGQGSGNGVRVTHLRQGTVRDTVTAPGSQLSESSDLTVTVGMGLSSPVPQLSAGGRLKGLEGMYPTGFSLGAGVAATLSATDVDLVDVNGDGLADQVRRDKHRKAFRVRLNLGSRFASQEDLIPVDAWDVEGDFDPLVARIGVESPPDADEDEQKGNAGVMGALGSLASPDVVRRNVAVTLEGNLGLTIAEDYGVTANWASSLNGTQVALVDVTGDGLPDYVRKSPGENAFRVMVNRGYGFSSEQLWPVPDWLSGVTRPNFKVNPLLDSTVIPLLGLKDGVDTVEASGSHSRMPSAGFVFTVALPLAPPLPTPWLHLSFGADFTPERISGFELGLMDINGDGLADHVLKTEEATAPLGTDPDESRPNRGALYARLNGYSGGANLLRKVKRPLGGSFTLDYRREGNTVDMPESRFVLSNVWVEDGSGKDAPGHTLHTRYEYEGGRYDRAERDFLGFSTVRRINPDGSRVVQTFHNERVTHKGLLLREETRDAEGRLYLATLHTYGEPVPLSLPRQECMAFTPFFLSAADACAPSFTPLLRVEHRFYEGRTTELDGHGMASAQTMQYDVATGNVTRFEDLGDLADPTDDLHARVTYADSPALTALHHQKLVSRMEVRTGTLSAPGGLLRVREGFYDERGKLIRQLAHIDSGRVAEHLLTWTGDGMLASMTSPPNARGERYQVAYTYEPVTRSMVETITDSLGYDSRVEYDVRFQEVRRTKDVAGNVTERDYDGFGRLSAVWGPYEVGGPVPTIEVAYDTSARPAWARTRNLLEEEGGDGRLDTVVFVDGLRRILQTKKDAEVEGGHIGMSVTGHLTFDAMGRVEQKGQTTFDRGPKTAYVQGTPVRPTTDTHDVLGRVVRTVGADGSMTTVAYDFGAPVGSSRVRLRSTVVDPMGNVRVLYRDVSDRVTAVEERIEGRRPTTRYETDALGQLVRLVDAAGNESAYSYDWLGRRTSIRTPDTGLTELRYDDANNLVERVDPNLRAAGLSIRYEHEFHRLKKVDYPFSDDVLYEYGPPNAGENAAGRVVRITDEVGVETRGYGRLGEVTRTTRNVRAFRPGDRPRTFETRFAHDSFGRMLRVRYPDGEEVRYAYDAGGLLKRAVGYRPGSAHAPPEVQVYLRSLEYDHFGQRTSLVFGNGVKTKYAYEPETRRLASLTTRTPRGRVLQALSYRYDRIGNIVGMVNALGQPVGRRSGAVSYEFSYDALYRLTSAKGTALARPGLVDRFESRFAYSDVHDMLRHTQVHELVSSRGGAANAARPAHSNHDDLYTYGGIGPHQATRIGDTLLTYDANGNTLLECRTVDGSVCAGSGQGAPGAPETHNHYRRYVWTEANTLRAVVDGGGRNATRFFYDAEGERVVKLGRGGTSLTLGQFFSIKGKRHGTKHIFAGPTRVASKLLPVPDGDIGFEVAEGSGTGSIVFASATGNENGCDPSSSQPQKCPVVVVEPPGGVGSEPAVRPATYYYHPDHLGSTSWVTDQLARVHEHVEYFPFGEVWRDQRYDSDGAPVRAPNYLFSAKEFDEETGLGYFGARYYDPRKARWVSADPFREEWGNQPPPILLSLYAYGNHAPLGWRDPTGKAPEWLHAALDVAGMVPVIGEVADGANALIYLSEGRYVEAGISAMGMIPVLGEAGKAGKWVAKGVKAAGETVVQKTVAKEVRGELLEQGQKKLTKECSGGACGVPGKLCFVAGTLVTTREGLKPIEEVREGEEVLSRDEETGRVGWKRVVRTFVTEGAEVLEVTLVGGGGTREKLGVTPDHPFRVEGKGWVEARDLEPGSRILTPEQAWLTTESVAETLARVTVYNFEVADYHTYFVGTQQAWVHNSDCGPSDSLPGGQDVTKRPGSFRKKTVQDAWDSAADGPSGGKLCPTCGTEVKVPPGKGTRQSPRDWDVDHQPPWSQRDKGNVRSEVLDNYNQGTRLECPSCNRSRGAKPAE